MESKLVCVFKTATKLSGVRAGRGFNDAQISIATGALPAKSAVLEKKKKKKKKKKLPLKKKKHTKKKKQNTQKKKYINEYYT
eukprot:NODE_17946_length_918_cov_8.639697.p4 GENE.NODE_17946_length_918_cov_8.639697~~NODE_17946_length_918_cov_8.639697.p4  ORF type:complete len:82 (-),score=40.35 NODE_17946_length_918_cov_8.639697:66-311(-)